MKSVLAFGDSNTWGLIPGSRNNDRYPFDVRWTGILQNSCRSVHIIEEGLCGRTTASEDELKPDRKGVSALPVILKRYNPLDAVILLLGTNDCKSAFHASPEKIGKGIELCLDEIEEYLLPCEILLVSPAVLGEDVWKPEKDPEFGKESAAISRALKAEYRKIARKRGTAFLDASDYVHVNAADSEHLDEEGHRILAMAICRKLRDMKVL